MGGMNNASADLTNTTTVASNTGVDNGADTSLDDLADIDTGSGTAEAQSGDLISSALTLGDLVHLGGVLDGIGNGAAYDLTIAGAAAMQKPPMPVVSVMQLSPTSRLASASVKPGK